MESEDEQEERHRGNDDADDDANADLTLDILARANSRRKKSQSVIDEIEAEKQQQQIAHEHEEIKKKKKKKDKAKNGRGKRKQVDISDGDEEKQVIVEDQTGKTFVVLGKGTGMSDPLVIVAEDSDVRLIDRKEKKKKRRKNKDDEPPVEAKPDESSFDEPAAYVAGEDFDGPEGNVEPGTPEVITIDAIREDTPPEGTLTDKKRSRFRRYFDPPPGEDDKMFYEACFNCGETGHYATECTAERRRRPCYVCGECTHEGKFCPQKAECYVCNQVGHQAKDCTMRGKIKASKRCLHCGDTGHDVGTCKKDYDPEDLKAIQCYVCKRYGHLCCTDGLEKFPRQASCYNCGNLGHTGMGCARSRKSVSEGTPKSNGVCYKCGGEGHFARGCSQGKWPGPWDENDEGDFPRGPQRDSRARNFHNATPSKPQQRYNYNSKKQESFLDDLVHNANMRLRKWNSSGNENGERSVVDKQNRNSVDRQSRRGTFNNFNHRNKAAAADY